MAVIFLEGFDKYGSTNINSGGVVTLLTAGEWTSAVTGGGIVYSIVAGLSSTGFALNVGNSSTAAALSKTLSGNFSRIIGGVRFSSRLLSVAGVQFTDAGTAQASIVINTNGTIAVRNGTAGGTILGTSSASISANTIHYLEWDITFGNVGVGLYQIWLDNASILSGSGDTTTTANNFANAFVVFLSTTGGNFTIDDLYLFDSTGTTNNAVLLTSPRIETQFPTSDGAVQFAFGAGILGSSLGRSTTSNNSVLANSLFLRKFTPAAACTLSSISLVPSQTSAGANFRGVVYADSAGIAGALLSSGTQVTGVTSGVTSTLPLTTPQSLSAGTQYWLGFINDTNITYQQTDNDTQGFRVPNTYASGAPNPAWTMSGGQFSVHLWGNLTGSTGNFSEVSQQPPVGANSYVFDATVGHEDLYGFPALSALPASIYAVAVKANVARSDTGSRTVSMRTKSGATDSAGSLAGQTPATTFGWLASYFPTDPNTSAAWTGTNLDAATSGLKIDS